MPKAQRLLDFPVRKSAVVTRTRSKRVTDKENVPSPRKRSAKSVTSKDIENCSPTKRSKPSSKVERLPEDVANLSSPKRAPLSPSCPNKILPHGYLVLSAEKPVRGILTPSKQQTVLSPVSTPNGHSFSLSPYRNTPTPTKVRALTFSPAKLNCENVDLSIASAVNILSKVRALDFTPKTSSGDSKVDTETKVSTTDHVRCEGVKTPSRQSHRLLLTPTRQSPRLKSPLRQSGKKCASSSTKKQSVKKLSFAPACSALKSPVKERCAAAAEVRRSPRKLQSPVKPAVSPRRRQLLQSPRKREVMLEDVRRSPRKHTPLRLGRHEGLCYQAAKRALHTALPEKLLCREKQYGEVKDFLDQCLKRKQAGSLYISGAPGTGKTAVLSHTLQRLQEEKTKVIYINCMSVKNSQAIFNRVLADVTGKPSNVTTKSACAQLEKCLTSKGPMLVLIMDEVDQLDSKNQEVLYTMFEWPHLARSRLVLIGIANALDLTDRILPRLQAKPKCKPRLLHFPPYSKDQIVSIIQDRLAKVEVGGTQVLDAGAVQFCARKVAAVAGDMRKALDVCRRAIEMVENEVKRQQILTAVSQSPSKRGNSATGGVPKKIGVAHIMKTVNEVYGSRSAPRSCDQATVPLQQKLAICALLLTLRAGKAKEVPLGKLHENYKKVCRKQEVAAIDQSEFVSLVTLVEARGLIGVKKAKETRLAKVWLKLDEGELERTLQDKSLMASVLQHGL